MLQRRVLGRVPAIDALRGWTILNMVFFNDLESVYGIPAWLHHAPEGSNRLHYMDAGVPGFLFCAGLAIPVALAARRARGESARETWEHILRRSIALIMMGVWMVYGSSEFHPHAIGMSQPAWCLWMYLGFLLLWFDLPPLRYRGVPGRALLRVAGAAILAWLFVIYHSGMKSETWLPAWWGILGTIGWTYLISSALYLRFDRFIGRIFAASILGLPLLYALVRVHRLHGPDVNIDFFLDTVMVLTGVFIAHRLFLNPPPGESPRRKLALLAAGVVVFFVLGRLYEPIAGISKESDTPAFIMYSLGVAIFFFAIFVLICDVLRGERFTRVLLPAAHLPLTMYLLVEAHYEALDLGGINFHYEMFPSGAAGMMRSAVLTGIAASVIWAIYRRNPRWGI
jgi:predicted acyltransferase